MMQKPWSIFSLTLSDSAQVITKNDLQQILIFLDTEKNDKNIWFEKQDPFMRICYVSLWNQFPLSVMRFVVGL